MKTPEEERAVIGGCLLESAALHHALVMLSPEDFESPLGIVFEAMRSLVDDRVEVDVVTLASKLSDMGELDRVGGLPAILPCTEAIPTAANQPYYVELVLNHSKLRQLRDGAAYIARKKYANPEEATDDLYRLQRRLGLEKTSQPQSLYGAALGVFRKLEKVDAKLEQVDLLPTGFDRIDANTGGLGPEELWIVGGATGSGKTALVMSMVENACTREEGAEALVFSLEMGKRAMGTRHLSRAAGVDGRALRVAKVEDDDWPKLREGVKRLEPLRDRLLFVTRARRLDKLEAVMTAWAVERVGKKLVAVVDYLQLVKSPTRNRNREQEVAEVARSLKDLSVELGITVVALSPLNRQLDKSPGKKPDKSQLRESGEIEYAADSVLLIWRPKADSNPGGDPEEAKILFDKTRYGPRGEAILCFEPRITEWRNASGWIGARR